MELRDFLIRAHICSQYYGGSVKKRCIFYERNTKITYRRRIYQVIET